jgi:hypothetical protein
MSYFATGATTGLVTDMFGASNTLNASSGPVSEMGPPRALMTTPGDMGPPKSLMNTSASGLLGQSKAPTSSTSSNPLTSLLNAFGTRTVAGGARGTIPARTMSLAPGAGGGATNYYASPAVAKSNMPIYLAIGGVAVVGLALLFMKKRK